MTRTGFNPRRSTRIKRIQNQRSQQLPRLVYSSLSWLLNRGVREVTNWVLPVIDRPLLANRAVSGWGHSLPVTGWKTSHRSHAFLIHPVTPLQ